MERDMANEITFEKLEELVRERAEQGVVLFDIGETCDESGDGRPWSVLAWASEGIDPEELLRQCDEDGDYGEGVRCFGPALECYSLRDLYEDWVLDGIESWPIHRPAAESRIFEITLTTTISKAVEVEAADFDAALAELRRRFRDGELDEMRGWVRIEAADDSGDTWELVAEYDGNQGV